MARGPRNVSVRFCARSLTSFGSVYLLHRFFSRLGLKGAIATGVRLPQRNNRYSVGERIWALIYPTILSLERLEPTPLLTRNGVVQYLTGLPASPNATTLRRFLLRLAPALSLRGDDAPCPRTPVRSSPCSPSSATPMKSWDHPGSAADQSLAVLQRPGSPRTGHPGTQGRLPHGTHPDQALLREGGLLPPALRRTAPRNTS